MSSNSNGTAVPGSSSILPPTETITSTAQIGQGDAASWNFENLEDKNPFSEFSEEHLNKLDEVLSSVEVHEILQQSATNFNLNMSLEDGSQQSEPVVLQEADLSVLSAAFSDHAYAVPPDRAPKTRPTATTVTSQQRPVVVTIGPSEISAENVINITPAPTSDIPARSYDMPTVITVSAPSPVAVSPRKSGRALKSKQFGEDEWVTSSPRGRGRGKGSPRNDSPVSFGSLRQSSRISDQKQRELAEKILQANRQAMEAEKLSGSSAEILLPGISTEQLPGSLGQPEVKGEEKGSQADEDDDDDDDMNVDVETEDGKSPGQGKGRGRGRMESEEEKTVGKGAISSQDDDLDGDEDTTAEKTTADDEDESEHEDDETSEASPKKKPKKPKKSIWVTKRRKKKKKVVKKSTETEETADSDMEDEDDKKKSPVGKKVGKLKGKKDEDTGDSELSDLEEEDKSKKKAVKGKVGKGKAKAKGKADSEDSEEESESEEDEEAKSPKKAVKGKKGGKKKEPVKVKKVKEKKKGNAKKDESQTSDMETDEKSKAKKTGKKLSKKERLKKLKEAKKLKKAKLLAKKKAKLKERKLQKGKAKASKSDLEKSPKKKKLSKDSESDVAVDTKEKGCVKGKKKTLAVKVVPGKKKKGKATDEKTDSESQGSPKKKKGKLAENKTDSDTVKSPKKKKAKLTEDKTDSETPKSPKKKKGQLGAGPTESQAAVSPKKLKGKQTDGKVADDSGAKATMKGVKAMVESLTKKMKEKVKEEKDEDIMKSPVKVGKRKETDDSEVSPGKKKKTVEETKSLLKGEKSDSDDDVPLKTIKTELQGDQQGKEPGGVMETTIEILDQKTEEQKNEKQTAVDTVSSVSEVPQSKGAEKVNVNDLDLGGKDPSSVNSSVRVERFDDKKDGKRKLSSDKDSFEVPSKKRDSRDSSKDSKDDRHRHRHHSHHHHRHSRDSRDSVSEDRKHSHDRRDSHRDKKSPSRRKDSHSSSHDRKESVSSDRGKDKSDSRDRKSSLSKDKKDSVKDSSSKGLKKGERRSSVSSAGSDQKITKTPAKVEKKKPRKSEDIPVDASLIDLFKPDVTPKQKLKSEERVSLSSKPGLFESLEAKFNLGLVKDKLLSLDGEAVIVGEKKDTASEILSDVATSSILSTCDNVDQKTDHLESINVDKKEDKLGDAVESKPDLLSHETISDLSHSTSQSENEPSEINKETAEKVLNPLDSDKIHVASHTDVKQEITKEIKAEQVSFTDVKKEKSKEISFSDVKKEKSKEIKSEHVSFTDIKKEKSKEVSFTDVKKEKSKEISFTDVKKEKHKESKSEDSVKPEKGIIRELERKVIKTPGSKEIKKEKSLKMTPDKKKRPDEKRLSLGSNKERKSDSKEKTPGKSDKLSKVSSESKLKQNSKEKDVSSSKKGIISGDSAKAKKKHLSGDSVKQRKLSGESKQRHPSGEGRARPNRNKSVSFAEILKKEKLGSDVEDNEDEDSDFNDDENDETWEEPGKLYCLCRQPHNKRFMICCDKCEEWFHGKCVGISRARGEVMEKNDEEYICPQCSEKETEMGEQADEKVDEKADEKAVVTSTESPDQSHKKTEPKSSDSSERVSVFESISTTSADKSEASELPKPDSTVTSPVKKEVIDSETPVKGKHSQEPTPGKIKHGDGETQRKRRSSEGEKGNIGYIRKRSPKEKSSPEKKKRIKSFEPEKPKVVYSKRKCVCGCNKLAKVGSLYSETECQEIHKRNKREESEAVKQSAIKVPQEKRIAVVERGTGKTLTGHKAPRESEIKEWLQKHPTYEILKAHRRLSSKSLSPGLNTSKDTGSDSSQVSEKERTSEESSSEKPLPEGPEPVRLNVRKGLRDALAARADAAEDVMLSNSEVKGLALSIEEEMFNCFKDTDHKYKAKYRSLVFNIKDQKNKGLFRKILNRKIRAYRLVRMSPEELASQELSKWREHETKHQIEMIEQTEAELEQGHPHITKKTHKGEVEVEQEGEEDFSSLSVPLETKKEAPKIDPKADILSSILPDTTDQHGKHLFDSNCKVCTGKLVPHSESPEMSTSAVVMTESVEVEPEEPELTQKEKDIQAEEMVKEVLKAIKKAQIDAKREAVESQKKASSVTVRSPDSALSSGLDKKVKYTPSGPQLWKGFIYMQDVSKFVTTAYRVTGPADHLELPDTIHVCGRINPEHVWDYLSKVKQAASRDICVVRFIPGNNEEKEAYIKLYSYLNSRSRCGVVADSAKHIKDFYIVPLASHSKIPAVLKPFDGPGLEENRCHMLIGVIIRNKVKASSMSGSSSQPHKQDPRKLKSSLKDPGHTVQTKYLKDPVSSHMVPDDKTASSSSSSSSSTPLSSASSVTPLEKKKKAKSISFDPIVKEYSHVSSDPDEVDDSNDPDAPYDPEKEAVNTTPKQESKAEDPVAKMIEKIALSKNPVEATATMVAALATSGRLGNQNQRKLLLELTKKVDEQKKMLEKKKISTRSPSSISSSSSPSDKSAVASTLGSSPHSSVHKSHLNKNDPRLKAKKIVEAETLVAQDSSVTVSSASSVSTSLVAPMSVVAGVSQVQSVYSPLKDLQASKLGQSPVVLPPASDSDKTAVDSNAKDSTSPTKKLFSFTIKPKSHPVTKLALEEESDSKISLPKLDEDVTETIMKPTGFYVDHGDKSSKDDDQTHKTGKDKDSSESSGLHPVSSGWEVVSNESDHSKIPRENSSKVSEKDESDSDIVVNSSKIETEKGVSLTESNLNEGANKEGNTTTVDEAHTVKAYDIVSQLQAEVSGTTKTDTKSSKESSGDSETAQENASGSKKLSSDGKEGKLPIDILSQLHASVWGAIKDSPKTTKQSADSSGTVKKSSLLETDSGKSQVKLPANIMNIIKEVSEKPGSKVQAKVEASQPSQLPNALMSLFSTVKSSDSKVDKKSSASHTVSDSKTNDSLVDEDLRVGQKKAVAVNVVHKPVDSAKEAKPKKKVPKEKASKAFFGFDYDSDSDSEGSFEGFDDDGVKSLSPRKRKLVAKRSPAQSEGVVSQPTNEYGDIDIRVQPDINKSDKESSDSNIGLAVEDIDLRLQQKRSDKTITGLSKETDLTKEIDIGKGEDKDMRKMPYTLPKPPGEATKDYDVEDDPSFDVDERIKRQVPIGAGLPGDKSDSRSTILLDVDHRRPPFPGPFPPGMGPPLSFMLNNQPPPPGEDWQPGQPAPPPLPPGPRRQPPPLPQGLPPPPPMPLIKVEENQEKDKEKIDEKPKPKEKDEDSVKDKKDKTEGTEGKEKKKKKDKKGKEKKKGELLPSDQRLKAIVLEIAKNEPIEPPPLPPPILQPSVGPPMSMTMFTGPPPMSVPPSMPMTAVSMMSAPGPMISQPPNINAPPVSSQGPPFTSHGHMPHLAHENSSTAPSGPWTGPPSVSSPGPPALLGMDLKPHKKSSSRPHSRGNLAPGQPPLLPTPQPFKPGLLPTPLMPPISNASLGSGGPNTVSSAGPPPFRPLESGGTVGSPRMMEPHDDSYPPPLLPGPMVQDDNRHSRERSYDDRSSRERAYDDRSSRERGYDDRSSRERGSRYRDRDDRHSGRGSRERDRHRHRHRDDRDRHEHSDGNSVDRHRDDHQRDDDHHRDGDHYRDDDRHRDSDRYRDDDRHRDDRESDRHRDSDRYRDDDRRRDDRDSDRHRDSDRYRDDRHRDRSRDDHRHRHKRSRH